MTIEHLIEQIFSKRPDVPKELIEERLKKERLKTNGYISDETLLRMIALELGVETQNHITASPRLLLASLVPSLNNVTVVGRVVAVFAPRSFNGKKPGKLASFLIADASGLLRVVVWNDKTSLIESGEIRTGQVLRISHGYTKDGPSGVELHVGERCQVDINPEGMCADDFPSIGKFVTRIGELVSVRGNRKVNVMGTAGSLCSTSTFERQDLSLGKVMRFTLADETGEIPIVAWNEKADELEKMLTQNVGLQLVNAKLKKSPNEASEIHVDSGTYVESYLPAVHFLRICDLEEGLSRVNVKGEISTLPKIRDVTTSRQEVVKLAGFELKDGTGRVWVSAWRKHADTVANLKIGDRITMKHVGVKKGFGDQLEVSTKDVTAIEICQPLDSR
jgi:replication factor A1